MFAMHGTAGATMPTYVMEMSTLSATPNQAIQYGNIIKFQATITGNEEVPAMSGTPFPVRVVRYGQTRKGGVDWSSEEQIMHVPHPNQPLEILTFTNGFPITAKGPFATEQNQQVCFILMQGSTQVSQKACVSWAPAKINLNKRFIPKPKPKIPVNPEKVKPNIRPGMTEQPKMMNLEDMKDVSPQLKTPARDLDQLPQQNLQR